VTPLLEIDDLSVTFHGANGPVQAVRTVSLAMGREKLAIVGESGSGKSITARAVLGLLPARALVRARRLAFDGIDLLAGAGREAERLRGQRLTLILQDPRYALNPVVPVGGQIAEVFRHTFGESRRVAKQRALASLERVRIRDPLAVYGLYPHQVSGGMGQRVMIAMMLAAEPDLVIADEPTSALDASVQESVLELLDDLVSSRGIGLLLISHDLGLVSSFCDRVVVMRRGRVVEERRAADLAASREPYTRALLDSVPRLDSFGRDLPTLPEGL
jgi:peptide/nickel transport system ATP-binding protein